MKSLRYPLLIVFVSSLPLLPLILTPHLPHTHDGPVHLARMAAYYKALLDGQILPRWAGDLNFGYGVPLFNFIYHTPYLLASLFIHFRVTLVTTFKIVAAISYLLSGLFMFSFVNTLLKDKKTALLVALFYQFAPFRLVEMMVRGSLGEMYSYTFFPLVLYGLSKVYITANTSAITLTAVATFLLIISHNSMSLVFFVSSLLFLFFVSPSRKGFGLGLLSLALGIMASAFYWLPALAEHKYTYGDLFMKTMFRSHFPPPIQLLLPNFFNSPLLQTGGVSVQIGVFHILAVVTMLILVFRKRKVSPIRRRVMVFSLVLTAIALFFTLSISRPLWEEVSLLRQFQFPWRFLSLIAFSSSLSAIAFQELPWFRKPLVLLSITTLLIVSTSYFWKPPLGFDKIESEKAYWDYPLNTTYFGETDVIWSAGPAKEYPKDRVEIIDGKATVTSIYKRSNFHTYTVSSETSARLVDHTQYFPGWRVYVDGSQVPIEFQDQNWRGLITFPVSPGNHAVKVVFAKSKIQFIAETISWMILILLLASAIITKTNAGIKRTKSKLAKVNRFICRNLGAL